MYEKVGIQEIVDAAAAIQCTKPCTRSNEIESLIVSCQHFGYMIVKTVSGPLADVVLPSLLLSSSLLLTGFTLASFTAASSVLMFSVASFLCGFFQGPAWGACAVLLKQLVASEQFATWWGILSISSNVAGTFGPYLSAALINNYGWRSTFATVSTATMAFAGVSFVTLRLLMQQNKKAKDTASRQHFLDVFTPQFGLVFLSYMLVSTVRGACTDWGSMFLMQSKQRSLVIASSFSSTQEIGGIVGSVAAGYVADMMVSKNSGSIKPRYIISLFLTILQTVGVLAFIFCVDSQSSQMWINFVAFLIGFGMYGAITLFGVLAMEVAPANLAGTSHSMVTLGANLGRVMAGYPLSLIATLLTWHESFLAVLVISLLSVSVLFIGLQYRGLTEKKNI
ncbi:glucose-6-phosphate translocase [Plakobranchus ocellatus]|uniref:Glucose-6-phosphate translocase n=1 Tax=Plakobranchus ocellatus TaxID=259542 RepID=A0AAV4A335_9GAST|nr:glucose-6-phosphate translocase [Plakobranchus ocellatus]